MEAQLKVELVESYHTEEEFDYDPMDEQQDDEEEDNQQADGRHSSTACSESAASCSPGSVGNGPSELFAQLTHDLQLNFEPANSVKKKRSSRSTCKPAAVSPLPSSATCSPDASPVHDNPQQKLAHQSSERIPTAVVSDLCWFC